MSEKIARILLEDCEEMTIMRRNLAVLCVFLESLDGFCLTPPIPSQRTAKKKKRAHQLMPDEPIFLFCMIVYGIGFIMLRGIGGPKQQRHQSLHRRQGG